jgi:hypothetical protein
MTLLMGKNLARIKNFAVLGLLCSAFAFGSTRSGLALDFLVTLRGVHEIPPNNSSRVAVGSLTLNRSLLWYFVRTDLRPSAGGIFGPAPAGAKGPLILEFINYGFTAPWWPRHDGEVVYGDYVQLTDAQVEELKAGLWYINLTSTNYPSGELRGQICPLTPDGDCDNDSVPNSRDDCPSTPPGAAVDTTGCAIDELVPCYGPWKDHKEYVKAFRETTMRFWKEGRITVAQRNALIKQADLSVCGPVPPPPPCFLPPVPPPASIAGQTFWLHNGGIITANPDATYRATLAGVVQTGDIFWAPAGNLQTIVLLPNDGSPISTLNLVITDFIGCDVKGGTYLLQETGQSGMFSVTDGGHPF